MLFRRLTRNPVGHVTGEALAVAPGEQGAYHSQHRRGHGFRFGLYRVNFHRCIITVVVYLMENRMFLCL